jgi:protein-disulfide isomerase
MKKLILLSSLIFLVLTFAVAQTATQKKKTTASATKSASTASPAHSQSSSSHTTTGTLLPSQAEVEEAMKRSFGYDPGVRWQVYNISESPIPGVADALVSMNQQNPVHIYIGPDGKNAIIGELIPFGPNPFEPARQKLKIADGPARGPQNPVISMVEFSDLECPHCKAAQPIMEKLAGDFPQVRYVFQQFPLPATIHPWAMKAAQYTDCAARINPNAFWKYVDTVFENQGSIALATSTDKLKEYATSSGLDAEKVAACAVTPETEARVKKSMDLGMSLAVNSTPTVFINGRRVVGPANIPYDQLKALVQFEIDHANR